MNLSLDHNVQKLILERVQSGKYATLEDVVTAAIVTLEQQERLGDFAAGELDAFLAEGEESLVKEGILDGDDAWRLRRERRAQARKQAP